MIGAVVGVQPFGGEGLSGTGPKAGGPHYLLPLLRRADADDQHRRGRRQRRAAGRPDRPRLNDGRLCERSRPSPASGTVIHDQGHRHRHRRASSPLVARAGSPFALNWSYSSGERAGWVQKFSHKGWICKTWEGELALVSLPGSSVEKFYFTVHDDAPAQQLSARDGQARQPALRGEGRPADQLLRRDALLRDPASSRRRTSRSARAWSCRRAGVPASAARNEERTHEHTTSGLHRRRQHGRRHHRRPASQRPRRPRAILVVDPGAAQRDELRASFGVRTLAAADASLARGRVGGLGRQAAAASRPPPRPAPPIVGGALQLSVMAGIRSDAIVRATGSERVVRAMPNTPALIGQGIAGLYARAAVSAAERAAVEAVLAPTGRTLWVGARGRSRRGDRAVGLGPGLRLLLRRGDDAGGAARWA